MSQIKLNAAKEFIDEKNYSAARVILSTLSENPIAAKWLARLNEIAPEIKAKNEITEWEYCTMFWTLSSFALLDPDLDNDDLETAAAHYFTLCLKSFSPAPDKTKQYDIYDANSLYTAQRNGKFTELITYSEENVALYRVNVGDLDRLRKVFKEEETDKPEYSFQYHLLAELRQFLEIAPETYIARLGLEGWQLIFVREYEPWFWGEVGYRLRETLTAVRLMHYFKRPLTTPTPR